MAFAKIVLQKNGAVSPDPYTPTDFRPLAQIPGTYENLQARFGGFAPFVNLAQGKTPLQSPGDVLTEKVEQAVTAGVISPIEAEIAKHQVDIVIGIVGIALVVMALSQIVKVG